MNPYEKTYQVKNISSSPISPENYPDKCITFSEAIKLICGIVNEKLLFIPHLEWLFFNEQVMKLLTDLSDEEAIDFSKILVNQNNLNEWRYSSPKVELEMLLNGAGKKDKIEAKLDSIKRDTRQIQNIYSTTQLIEIEFKKIKLLIKGFSENQTNSIKSLFEELEEIDSKLLQIEWNNELLYSKINELTSDLNFTNFSKKEKNNIRETLNRMDITLKHKLKFIIPLFFLKYEAEIELGDKQKMPENLKELKELFLGNQN